MALPLPRSLSPSKVSSFKDCALAFRFSAIDRLAEPTSPQMAKGTLVHMALERLFWYHPAGQRNADTAKAELQLAWEAMRETPDITMLGLDGAADARFVADAAKLVKNYFALEDPDTVEAVGTEITLEADIGGVHLRGIIDRLDRTADGRLVVVDYKTGQVPSENQEQSRLGGVQFYALLCEHVFGQRPAAVRLLYLSAPICIEADPSQQALRGLQQRTSAVWSAIERACASEDFRPKPSPLCGWCAYKPLCPAHGGDPALAASWPLGLAPERQPAAS